MKFKLKLKWTDLLIIILLIVLAILPDPSDVGDAGTPLLETVALALYLLVKGVSSR